MVKAPHLNCKGTWVRSGVMELTSHILQGTAEKQKKKKKIGTFLGIQWVRLHSPNAGGHDLALIRKLEPTGNKYGSMCHNKDSACYD